MIDEREIFGFKHMLNKFSIIKLLDLLAPLFLQRSKITYFHTRSVSLMIIAPSSVNFVSIGEMSHFLSKAVGVTLTFDVNEGIRWSVLSTVC